MKTGNSLLIKCFVWQAFRLELDCERLWRISDFATQHQNDSIIEKQFREYELTERGVSAFNLPDFQCNRTFT